jgi:hypothetical protein
MNASHHEFKRGWHNGKRVIETTIFVEKNKGYEPRKLKFTFEFSCLSHLIRDLRTVWSEERKRRNEDIAAIDHELSYTP